MKLCGCKRFNLQAGVAIVALMASGAGAQSLDSAQRSDTIQEVVVTATKRSESAQNVPFGLTAMSEGDLSARGAQTVEEALAFVPGVSFSSNGSNSGSFAIRGVSTSSSVVNAQSPVALYIDDINVLDPTYPKISTNLRLFDAARVEVLEGPQGTLFGSGSLGGAVRIITNKPDLDAYEAATEDTVKGTAGGGVGYDANAMVNLPILKDQLAIRAVAYFQQDAGYVDNVATGRGKVNNAISEGGRVEVKWAPSQDFSLTATILSESDRPKDSAYSFYDSGKYQWDGVVANTSRNDTTIYSVTAAYDFPAFSVTSISTFADRKEETVADFTSNAILLAGISNPSPVYDQGPSRTFSQELRIASSGTDKFRWLAGVIYLDNRKTTNEDVYVPGSGALIGSASDDIAVSQSNSRIQEAALFGEVSYELLDGLTLTAGGRLFQDVLAINQTVGGTFEPSFNAFSRTYEAAFTPKINLSYQFGHAQMAYAQISEGYRVGQVNPIPADPVSGQLIPSASHPDKLWNYEIGEKGTYLDGHLMLNASLYYIDWERIQLNALTDGAQINYIANAGEARIYGAELAAVAKPWPHWDVGASMAVNSSRLDSTAPGVSAQVGDRLPGSARQTADAYLQYTHTLGGDVQLSGRIDGRYVGKEYADLDNPTSLTYGNYASLNLRASLDWDAYGVTAFIDNLTNGNAKTSAFPNFNIPVAIRQVPLTAGVTFNARF